jgi:hypothetical protein
MIDGEDDMFLHLYAFKQKSSPGPCKSLNNFWNQRCHKII